MKKITRLFLALVSYLCFCFPSYAAEWTRFYDIKENGSEQVYYVQIPAGSEFGYYYAEDAVNPVPYMYCTVPFEYCIGDYTPSSSRYSSDKKYASGGQVFYVGGSNYKTMIGSYGNAIGIPASDTVGVYDYLLDNGFIGGSGGSGDSSYSSAVPTPLNVRYVKTGEKTASLVWDNNDPDGKYYAVIRGIYHWKNNNPAGAWVSDKTGIGKSSGDVSFQLLSSADMFPVKTCRYDGSPEQNKEIEAAIAKEAKDSAIWWSWYPTQFQIQFWGTDEDGNPVYGDSVHCTINWKNIKKGEWTSTSVVYDGGLKDDTGIDGEQSTTTESGWGAIHGGGGVKWDTTTEYDQSGNVVDSDSVDSSVDGLLNMFGNLPNIFNRFFQMLQSLVTGLAQLPALFAQVVAWLPEEMISLFGSGLLVVIFLRVVGR